MAKALTDFVHGRTNYKAGDSVDGLDDDTARRLEERGLIQGKMSAGARANKAARGGSENKGNAAGAGEEPSSASPAVRASRRTTSPASKNGGKRGRKSGT